MRYATFWLITFIIFLLGESLDGYTINLTYEESVELGRRLIGGE